MLPFTQEDVQFEGHAIECRINAEHPETFVPTPGTVNFYHPAGGAGVRVDTVLYSGYRILPYYDSLIAKLIVHGRDRDHALARLRLALQEFVIEPIPTTLDLHKRLVDEDAIKSGDYSIKWLEKEFFSRRLRQQMEDRFIYSPETIIKAYSLGVFLMASAHDADEIYFYELDMRGILPLSPPHIPRRLLRLVRQTDWTVTLDRDFRAVIEGCSEIHPDRQDS